MRFTALAVCAVTTGLSINAFAIWPFDDAADQYQESTTDFECCTRALSACVINIMNKEQEAYKQWNKRMEKIKGEIREQIRAEQAKANAEYQGNGAEVEKAPEKEREEVQRKLDDLITAGNIKSISGNPDVCVLDATGPFIVEGTIVNGRCVRGRESIQRQAEALLDKQTEERFAESSYLKMDRRPHTRLQVEIVEECRRSIGAGDCQELEIINEQKWGECMKEGFTLEQCSGAGSAGRAEADLRCSNR